VFAMLFVVCCLSPDRIVGRVLFRGRKAAKVSIENKMGRRVSVNFIVYSHCGSGRAKVSFDGN